MPTIYFVIDAPYGYISNGRVNWLYNITEQFNKNKSQYRLHIICRSPTNRTKIYDFKVINNIKITRIPLTDTNNLFFRILDKISFRFFNVVRSYYFSFMSLLAMLKIKENDIVFGLNPGFEVLPAILLRKILKKKITITCVMKGLFAKEQYHRLGFLKDFFFNMEKKTLKECDKVFCNGFDSQAYIASQHKIQATILPNGVNINAYSNLNNKNILSSDPTTLKKYNYVKELGQNKRIIMQIGSITEYKGVDYLLSAVSQVIRTRDDFVVVLVGKGATNSKYVDIINKYKLKETVYLIDEVPSESLKYFLNLADVVTNLSIFGIGFSMATLESLALSKINIAWDNIIYNQFLSEGEVVFVKNKNVDDLAITIDKIISNINEYQEVAKSGRRKSLSFDWINIYTHLIKSIS